MDEYIDHLEILLNRAKNDEDYEIKTDEASKLAFNLNFIKEKDDVKGKVAFKIRSDYCSYLNHTTVPLVTVNDMRHFELPPIPANDVLCLIKKQNAYGSSTVDLAWTLFMNKLFVNMHKYQCFISSCYNRCCMNDFNRVSTMLSDFKNGKCVCAKERGCDNFSLDRVFELPLVADLSKDEETFTVFECPRFFGRICILMGLFYQQLNHYAYWLRLKKNAIKSVFLEGYTNVVANISVKEKRCVGITVLYNTLVMLHSFLSPLQSVAMAQTNASHPEMMETVFDVYASAFTNKAQKILSESVKRDGSTFFDRLKLSEIMHIVRSCYTYGAMVNGSSGWWYFLESLKFKIAHMLSDVFETNVLDVPHLRVDITNLDFKYETEVVKNIIFRNRKKKQPHSSITLKKSRIIVKKAPIDNDDDEDARDKMSDFSEEKDAKRPMFLKQSDVDDILNSLSSRCDSASKNKNIIDEDVVGLFYEKSLNLFENSQETKHIESTMIEKIKDPDLKTEESFGMDTSTKFDVVEEAAYDDGGDRGDVEDDDDVPEALLMGNEAAHLYYGFFSSFSAGYFGEMVDIPKRKLFDLSVFDKYDTIMMKRKIKCHHDLALFFKLWSVFKLLNPSNVLRTEIRNKYVSMHVSRDDVNWFLCEGDLLDLKRRLTTDPERMLDKMYAMMAKQIKDNGSKKPYDIYKNLKNDSAYRGFMDWLRLYTATSCISVDVNKFFTKTCSKTLHFEQWISSKGDHDGAEDKKWFEQCHFPFIYMHNGRYNVFYNKCQIIRINVPLALIQTIEYLISDLMGTSSSSVDFDINFENHENILKMRCFWMDVIFILKNQDRKNLLKYDVHFIQNMVKALYIVTNASKVSDVHCYDNGDYLGTFENICAHYYKKFALDEKLIYSSLFNRTLSSAHSNDPENDVKKNDETLERSDVVNDIDHVFLNRIVSRNFNCSLYSETTVRSDIPNPSERKERFENNMREALQNLDRSEYATRSVLDCLFDIGDNSEVHLDNHDTAYETLATWVMLCLEYNDNPELKKKIKFGLEGSIKNIVRWYYEKSVYTNEDVSERMQKGEVEESVLKEDKRKAERMSRESMVLDPVAVDVYYKNPYESSNTPETLRKHKHATTNPDKDGDDDASGSLGTADYVLYEDDFEAFSRQDIGVYMKSKEQIDFLENLKRCIEIFKDLQNSITNYEHIYEQ